MRASLFWFNDEQWAKIEPLIADQSTGPLSAAAAQAEMGRPAPRDQPTPVRKRA
jgi:hypothetical protein